jgi:hypothetical protein
MKEFALTQDFAVLAFLRPFNSWARFRGTPWDQLPSTNAKRLLE